MYSAYKIQIHPDHELFHYCDSLCFKAKNLYNITNYYIRQVYTALKKETRNENQLQVLKDIETHLSKMNEIRHKSYEIAKMKPKKVDKSDKIIDVKFKTFEMPHLGHEMGDGLLKQFANRLINNVRLAIIYINQEITTKRVSLTRILD
jgi:putative transposase